MECTKSTNGEVVGLTISSQNVPLNIASKRKRWERLTFLKLNFFIAPSTYAQVHLVGMAHVQKNLVINIIGDHVGDQTHNLLLCRQVPYPLGHTVMYISIWDTLQKLHGLVVKMLLHHYPLFRKQLFVNGGMLSERCGNDPGWDGTCSHYLVTYKQHVDGIVDVVHAHTLLHTRRLPHKVFSLCRS